MDTPHEKKPHQAKPGGEGNCGGRVGLVLMLRVGLVGAAVLAGAGEMVHYCGYHGKQDSLDGAPEDGCHEGLLGYPYVILIPRR